MITIFTILKKRKKSVKDYIKIFLFGFFVLMILAHIGEIKPLESD
jgi:uncharacterized protein YhhL (DUF1145 family)